MPILCKTTLLKLSVLCMLCLGCHDFQYICRTEFKGVRSYPVGYVTEQMMRPMDFEEFCWAIGVREETLDTIRQCCEDERSVDEAVHEAMMRNFRTYLVVGGMPDAVNVF